MCNTLISFKTRWLSKSLCLSTAPHPTWPDNSTYAPRTDCVFFRAKDGCLIYWFVFKTFIILIVGLLCMLKHFTDNSQNGINRRKWSTQHGKRKMPYYDHDWKYSREVWFILFKFTDNCKMFSGCWISMVKINRSGEGWLCGLRL